MRDCSWKNKELDFFSAIDRREYREIEEYVRDNQHIVLSGNRTALRIGHGILKRFESRITPDNSAKSYFLLGKLLGTIECMNHCQHEKEMNAQVLRDVDTSEISYKLFKEVIRVVAVAGIISQKELMNKFYLSADEVEDIMKNFFFTESRFGEYKLYSLSDSGLRYYGLIKEQDDVD